MDKLRELDQIAYIRFASVYQSFDDLEDLKREVDLLYAERGDDTIAVDLRSGGEGRPLRQARSLSGPMSVLSDRDIRAALEAGEVAIRPYDPADLQPSSVDLHLDRSFRVFRNNRYAYIDVRSPQPDLTELLRVADDEPFILHPGEFVLGQTLEWVELPNDLVARLEGKSSLGRLGLLIHSTAGYVDPGWKGNLTLELSNVANLPIALYFGMKIGQISFFKMSSAVDRPYGSPELGSKYQGQSEPTASAFHRDFSNGRGAGEAPARSRSPSHAAERRRRLAARPRRRHDGRPRPGGHVPVRRRRPVRAGAADPLGPLVTDEIDAENRLLQALNCLLIETPAGRVLVETGIGDRVDDKTRDMRGYEGPCDRAGAADRRLRPRDRRRRRDEPPPLRPRRRPPRGRRRRGRSRAPRSSPSGPSGTSPSATTRGSSRATSSPSSSSSATGARTAGPTASARSCPASPSSRPAAIRPATRRSSCARPARRRSRSSATSACGRGARTRAG